MVTRFEVPDAQVAAFEPDARGVLAALAQRPGFVRGRLGRCVDEPALWALTTEWDSVGSYRRGLSSYDVKLATAALLAFAVPEASAYEVIATTDEPGPSAVSPTDRAR